MKGLLIKDILNMKNYMKQFIDIGKSIQRDFTDDYR